jgi:hypothetical protein
MTGNQRVSSFGERIAKAVNHWKPVVVYFPVKNSQDGE